MADGEDRLPALAQTALKQIQYSDSRIHILIAARADLVQLLDVIRNGGLFQKDHVWLTPIDLSDSIAELANPSDFNGLIMADALWEMPGTPAYDNFVTEWISLDPAQYDFFFSSFAQGYLLQFYALKLMSDVCLLSTDKIDILNQDLLS